MLPDFGLRSGDSPARVLCPPVTAAVRYRGEVLPGYTQERGTTPQEEALRLQQEEVWAERGIASMAAPSELHLLVAAMGEQPRTQELSPLVALVGSLVSPGVSLRDPLTSAGGCGCLAGPWAAGKALVGAWQPPKRLKNCQGAGTAAGAFLTMRRRSCHHSQPAAESSLVHC